MSSSNRVRGLGRGLESLIPIVEAGEGAIPQMVAVEQIRPSSQQVRARFDAEPLRELADSIRAHGLLQPVLVRAVGDGYQLIAGERRWRAARMAGLERIPVIVRSEPEEQSALILGLVENLQRTDLDPLEEARGLRALIDRFGFTHEEVAIKVGKHRVAISQSLRLLTASPALQSALSAGALTAGHARALVGLPTPEAQELGVKVVLGRRMSVRSTERWVRSFQSAPPPPRKRRPAETETARIAGELAERLGLPVSIIGSLSRGRISIQYTSRKELTALADRLSG
jgi:ParB family chromosome partitioning protein